jgi:azurin
MKITYEEVTNVYGDEIVIKSDGDVKTVFIKDLANSDYQAYLNKDKPQVEHLTEIPTE